MIGSSVLIGSSDTSVVPADRGLEDHRRKSPGRGRELSRSCHLRAGKAIQAGKVKEADVKKAPCLRRNRFQVGTDFERMRWEEAPSGAFVLSGAFRAPDVAVADVTMAKAQSTASHKL